MLANMKRNLVALVVLLAAAASLHLRTDDRLSVCGVRPGMTRAEVERVLDIPSDIGWGRWEYHRPHSGPGCHCECPRVLVVYDAHDVVKTVTGHELDQGFWIVARVGGPQPRFESHQPGLTIAADGPIFLSATLTR